MKILHVTTENPLQPVGGMGIHVANVAQEQARLGHDVHVLTQPGIGIKIDGYQVHSPTTECWSGGDDVAKLRARTFNMTREFIRLMLTVKPDVVHGHEWSAAEVYLNAKEFGVPVVSTLHLSVFHFLQNNRARDSKHGYYLWNECRMIRESEKLIVCSQYYKDVVKEVHGEEVESVVIPNGVRPESFGTNRRRHELYPGQERHVFFAGRWCLQKGLDTLKEIIDMMPHAQFHLCGDAPEWDELSSDDDPLEAIVRMGRTHPKQVKLYGKVTQERLGGIARGCDVWLAPSQHAPFEMVGLEAMACGVPLVCTNTGAFKEYATHNQNALLADVGDVASLVNEMDRIFYEPQTLRQKLVKNGLKTAAKFDWSRVARKLVRTYQEVICQHGLDSPREMETTSLRLPESMLLS